MMVKGPLGHGAPVYIILITPIDSAYDYLYIILSYVSLYSVCNVVCGASRERERDPRERKREIE